MSEDSEMKEFVIALESQVDDLTRRIEVLERTVESIRAVGEEFWRREAAAYLLGLRATSWTWDAGEASDAFPDMFHKESLDDGTAHRWLGLSGEISASVSISREQPLLFVVETVFFSAPQLEETLKLEADGREVRWSQRHGTRWAAELPDAPSEARLNFRLSIDPKLIPDGKDVSFSLAQIRIEPVGHKAQSVASIAQGHHPATATDANNMTSKIEAA